MAYFWTKLQISGILLSQGKQSPKLLETSVENLINKGLFTAQRPFFSWIRARKDKPKGDRRPTVCGEPLPERLRPCNPECSSKCLQISGCDDKQLAMRRLSNCRDTDKSEEPKSYWEIMFGWKPEVEKPPDPQACRIAYREKQRCREQDPRLSDPRYEITAGDVLIYTETPKPEVCRAEEPRPKPPPAHKLPKAVLTKRITERAEKTMHDCAAALQFEPSCDSPKCSIPKPPVLPFGEMRPTESQRRIFSCRDGLRARDVDKPLRRDANSCCASRNTDRSFKHTISSESDYAANSVRSVRAGSRVEQLIRLTRAADGNKCPEPFVGKASTNVSQCRTPCNSSSCKMSTSSGCQGNRAEKNN